MSSKARLYPWSVASLRSPVQIALRASGHGLLAISAKGQEEPSGLIKTGQLTHPRLETSVCSSGSLLSRRSCMKRQWGRRMRWRRSMEMWTLITDSSVGHLHKTDCLGGAGEDQPAAPTASTCVSDTFHCSRWCRVQQHLDQGEFSPVRQGRHVSWWIMKDVFSSKALNWLKGERHVRQVIKKTPPSCQNVIQRRL